MSVEDGELTAGLLHANCTLALAGERLCRRGHQSHVWRWGRRGQAFGLRLVLQRAKEGFPGGAILLVGL